MPQGAFVGREAEAAALAALLRRTPPETAVLLGPAGVGKTRLAAEVATALASRRLRPVTALASATGRAIPLGAFAGVLPSHLPRTGPLELLRAARDALNRQPDGVQPLLVLDDAHLLDDVSATLLDQLVGERICPVLATVRSPDPAGTPPAALLRWTWVERVELAPLPVADLERVAADLLSGPLAARTRRVLAELSGGNPLHLRELVASATAAGSLQRSEGVWSLVGRPPAPAPLVDTTAA
ncbi:AAA family ATPase, partial [Kineococcus glutinatus]|uniref:AAA family ATPase n=1 Tax=Kineococcus glutinatus TaxID=1070872 RepID=UPI0031E5B83C